MKLEVVVPPVADVDRAKKFAQALGRREDAGASYASLASLADPDGNGWFLQEITTRLPGR